MTSRHSRSLRHALALVLGVLAWLSANYLWQLQDRLGPHRQPVNVRFVNDVSVEARQTLERELGLIAGEERTPGTWTYLLTDQSPRTIGALVQSPLVEDTFHIDRNALRVVLDQPGLHPWVVELIRREWLPYVSWLLVVIGLVLAWSARSSAWAIVGRGTRRIRAAVLDGPDGVEATAGSFETLSTRQETAIGLGLCLLFLVPLLLYGPTEDEEVSLGMFSSQIYYRDMLHGRWSYWFAHLGFGTPMPIGHRLDFHPVFALGSLISLRAALSGLWIVHVGVMAVYFRRLLAACGLGPGMRLLFLGFYLFSDVSFVFFYDEDWISCVVPWTLYPVLVYYLRSAFMGEAATRWWLTTVRLGVLLSLWVLNAHPGYLVPLAIILAVYILAATPRTLAVSGALGTAGMFALIASAERIYFVLHEKGLFPATAVRALQAEYAPLTYLTAQMAPLMNLGVWRQPFVGAFVFAAAVAAPFCWRTADRHVRGCIAAFFVAVALSTVPADQLKWTGVSGVWLFRDPMVFFALLSAAVVAQSGLRAHRVAIRLIVLALLVLQCLQQFWVVVSPRYGVHFAPSRLQFYQHQGHPTGLGQTIVQAASRYGKRLYLSRSAQGYSRGRLSGAGIHVVTDYALLGLNPVNAWFKNVSMDRIHPSWALMYGYIEGQQAVIENPTLLDVLGIDLIVAMADEELAPEGLRRIERVSVDADLGLDIFANPDAWPKGVLLAPSARGVALPLIDGCGHTGALCRDYTALAGTRLPQDVSVRELTDGYAVHLPPSDTPRLLFLSAFYRPEWVATAADQALTIDPIAGAFIGVTVPPGIQDIQLAFRPRTRIALTWLSGVTLVALLVALAALAWVRSDRE